MLQIKIPKKKKKQDTKTKWHKNAEIRKWNLKLCKYNNVCKDNQI